MTIGTRGSTWKTEACDRTQTIPRVPRAHRALCKEHSSEETKIASLAVAGRVSLMLVVSTPTPYL